MKRSIQVLASACFFYCLPPVAADETIQVEWEPKELKGAVYPDTPFGYLGTPEVKFRVKNTSDQVVEFPPEDWLVVKRLGGPSDGVFVPPSPSGIKPAA